MPAIENCKVNDCHRRELVAQINELRKALQKIADLMDSEAGEPLDDAIEIAEKALRKSTQ